ncbi:MAG TPA: DUF1345 domain-containing protein [Steroidobacteraceae bacterium]|nr:DUF1345 domain-containing protein [Steroidobacteraceae bacterium]
MQARPWSWLRNHVRFWIASGVGVAVFFGLPHTWLALTRALTAWNVAVLILVPLIFVHHSGLSAGQLRERYRQDDPSAPVILLLVVVAAIVSVAGIVAFLPALRSLPPSQKVAHLLLAALTILDSWLLVPTIFTVHYADLFYSKDASRQPLQFPRTEEPLFWDFVYFSFTIAAACQTADVATTEVGIRRSVIAHSVISFLFNIAILGFAINVTAGLIS